MSRRRRDQQHVRLYDSEIRSDAYRSLSTDARALLIEFRALYNGQQNRLHMSVREVQKRLGISQRPAQRALAQLLDRGFIRLLNAGSFRRKARHATEYALTNEPFDGQHVAPKDYMAWKPTVADSTTHGSGINYREGRTEAKKPSLGSAPDYRGGHLSTCLGSVGDYTGSVPSGSAENPSMREPAQSGVLGDSMACPCGGSTSSSSERRNGSVLHYQRCGACGRCDRFVLKQGSEVLAVGRDAQRRFFENGNASAAAS